MGSGSGMTLAFVELRTDDRRGLVGWYVEQLGLEVTLADEAGDFTLLDGGSVSIAVRGGRGGEPSGSVALMFQVVGLDRHRDRLEAAGVEVSAIKESAEGYRDLRLIDPEGRPIHLFEWTGRAGD